uniref:Cytochrome c oxidase subunit 3 n=1 Tax=Histeromerus sp. QL-2013 TaxID=1421637 RepID=A0A0A6ZKL1_9HYME|nr:cytochrome c oxidase subunit III [Histeromerus sp. QL-2013]
MMLKFNHPYHLVSLSPWPLLCSFSLMIMLLGVVKWFYLQSVFLMINGYLLTVLIVFQWWRDIIRESTFQGFHTMKVLKGLRLGMLLFILSELMFFLSFFWSYFHMSLSPNVEIGSIWPPKEILVFNPYNIPLLNTLILLSSGFTITWCHYMILNKNFKESYLSIYLTVFLGGMFTLFQYLEYKESYFTISDSVYGSIFYMTTGFHGIHVIIGTIFIIISMIRLKINHYSSFHHFGFEAASWYWHFVDVVWLFLYIFVYWLFY